MYVTRYINLKKIQTIIHYNLNEHKTSWCLLIFAMYALNQNFFVFNNVVWGAILTFLQIVIFITLSFCEQIFNIIKIVPNYVEITSFILQLTYKISITKMPLHHAQCCSKKKVKFIQGFRTSFLIRYHWAFITPNQTQYKEI